MFATKDANDDEMLTSSEIAPRAGPRTIGPDAIKAAILEGSQASPGDSRLVLVNPGENGAELAKQLLARYGSKGNAPDSKKIKAEALGLDAPTFTRLDADKDGALDSEELAQFARRTPDVEITVRIGTKADGAADVDGTVRSGVEARLVKSTGGATMLEMGVTRVDFRAGAISNNANIRVPQFRLRDQYVNQFKAADNDNNGYLDQKEANNNRLFQSLFKALDGDGDGNLYERELVAYIDKIEEMQKAIQTGCVTLALSDRGSGLFELLDRDKDNRLSVREMRQAVELTAKLDLNDDGQLARGEVPRNFEMRVRPGPAGNLGGLDQVLVVARGGMPGNPIPERGAGPMWFRKMDANRDGDLSRREFLGNDDDFKRIDADRDGLISAQEAAAIDPNARETPTRRRQ
jgi:Ca2+-binding EF-hand superfamily protein